MAQNLTRIGPSSAETGEMEFWVSDPERRGDDDDEWAFAVYGDKDKFLASFVYPGMEAAWAARKAIEPVIQDLVFIATRFGEADPFCPRCKGEGWVCEDHPDQPSSHSPDCGMGKPCPLCNGPETAQRTDDAPEETAGATAKAKRRVGR